MDTAQSPSLFVDLSTAAAQTVQGGRCSSHRRSVFRPSFYYYRPRPVTPVFVPAFNYGYGYGGTNSGWSGGSVNQTVNVNVTYDD